MLIFLARLFAYGCICTAFFGTVRAQSIMHVDKLIVEQGDATQDAAVMPFEIIPSNSARNPTREVIYVTLEVFEDICQKVQASNPASSSERKHPSFVIKEFADSAINRELVVSNKTLKTIMRSIEVMLVGQHLTVPAWIHAI